MGRYERQTCLSDVGLAGQKHLETAHILVVGAGGLGCAALPYLVAAGLGRVSLVDGDEVSLSNLHRQVLYKETDINKPKVECAARHLRAINNHCEIRSHYLNLTPKNVSALCDDVDLVLDCADNFAVSYVLSDYCYRESIPLVSASVLGFNGYVGGFCQQSPSLRAIFPELPQRAQNCSSAGVLGPAVGTLGSIQAQFALNILLQLQPSPLGQLMSIDLRNLRQSSFRFDMAVEPSIEDTLHFIDFSDIRKDDWIVDLRAVDLQTGTKLSEAENGDSDPIIQVVTLDEFRQQKPRPKSEQRAVIACKTGLTAWRAARILQQYWQGEINLIAMGEKPLKLP